MQSLEHELNFLAPYTPEECATRLRAFVHQSSSFRVRTRLKLTPFKNGSYHFRIQRSYYNLPVYRRPRLSGNARRSNYIKLQVNGYLTAWSDSGSTIVIGETQILPKTFIVNGLVLLLFALGMLLLTTAFLGDFVCFAPVILVSLISFAHTTIIQPETLAKRYQKSFTQQIDHLLQGYNV